MCTLKLDVGGLTVTFLVALYGTSRECLRHNIQACGPKGTCLHDL